MNLRESGRKAIGEVGTGRERDDINILLMHKIFKKIKTKLIRRPSSLLTALLNSLFP